MACFILGLFFFFCVSHFLSVYQQSVLAHNTSIFQVKEGLKELLKQKIHFTGEKKPVFKMAYFFPHFLTSSGLSNSIFMSHPDWLDDDKTQSWSL